MIAKLPGLVLNIPEYLSFRRGGQNGKGGIVALLLRANSENQVQSV